MKRIARILLACLVIVSGLLAISSNHSRLTQAQTDERCFSETGYCISGSIRTYWEQNGGLPVFGFPITAQQIEQVEGTWEGPVQWFERDRLEDHGTQGVMAGRLGADILERAGTPWETFPTVLTAPSGCIYTDLTDHSLCEPFLSYWQNNGGLERFGYPITEPFEVTIDGWTGTVQYFERRRMEHHTELSGTPYEVLLGLLGNEIRQTPDLLPPPVPTPSDTPTATAFADTPTATLTPTPSPTHTATSTPDTRRQITITKLATIAQGTPGQEFSYVITVNTAHATSQSLSVVDDLPVALDVIQVQTASGACDVQAQQVSCNVTARNGLPASINIRVRIQDGTPDGTLLTNVARVSGDDVTATSEVVLITVLGGRTPTPSSATATTEPTPTHTPTLPPTPTPTPDQAEMVRRVVEHTNSYRQQHGCSALKLDDRLTQAAQGHSEDMAFNDFFSHTGSQGTTPWDRITATGYTYSTAAENIFAGTRSPEETVDGWYNSEGHRKNMLNCELEYIGVGYYYLENDTGNENFHTYWTQVFATP